MSLVCRTHCPDTKANGPCQALCIFASQLAFRCEPGFHFGDGAWRTREDISEMLGQRIILIVLLMMLEFDERCALWMRPVWYQRQSALLGWLSVLVDWLYDPYPGLEKAHC